jgi:hypothetical protein
MDVCVVFYGKDKRQKLGQSGHRSLDEVQRENKKKKNPAGGHGCLSLASVVCRQVEVSETGRSLIQRSPTKCGVSLCVIYKPRARRGAGIR